MRFEPSVGTWYIVVTCGNCGSTLYLFRDLNNGKGSLTGTYFVTCPRCDHLGEYEGRHYQFLPNSGGVTSIRHDGPERPGDRVPEAY